MSGPVELNARLGALVEKCADRTGLPPEELTVVVPWREIRIDGTSYVALGPGDRWVERWDPAAGQTPSIRPAMRITCMGAPIVCRDGEDFHVHSPTGAMATCERPTVEPAAEVHTCAECGGAMAGQMQRCRSCAAPEIWGHDDGQDLPEPREEEDE